MARAKPSRSKRVGDKIKEFELTAEHTGNGQYLLRLYLTGMTPKSIDALRNIKLICDKYLNGKYDLEVIDIYQRPWLAVDEQIIAAPTLIKVLPKPIRKLIGDLSNEDKVLLGLDLISVRKQLKKTA